VFVLSVIFVYLSHRRPSARPEQPRRGAFCARTDWRRDTGIDSVVSGFGDSVFSGVGGGVSDVSGSDTGQAAEFSSYEVGSISSIAFQIVRGETKRALIGAMPQRRFPPPWSVEETEACFIVRDVKG
jgi:hypothetical protein